jgi:hypothetical protein
MLFDVSPKGFQPGTTIQLNATILYAGTKERFTGYNTMVEFLDFRSDGSNTSQFSSDTDGNGEVILSTEYSSAVVWLMLTWRVWCLCILAIGFLKVLSVILFSSLSPTTPRSC